MSELKRNPEVPVSTRNEALCLCTNRRGIPRGPSQLEWKLDFPEAAQEAPRVPLGTWRGIPSHQPQLETNHEILPSMRDEALFSCSPSRAIPNSLSKLKRKLGCLHANKGGQRFPSQLVMKAKVLTTSCKETRVSHLIGR